MSFSSSSSAAAAAPAAAPAAAAPRPRLMITKLVMENFKSYGGVREIGPFHKCFSAVVGPNGSGKSNVIDAMLFVFGKRAAEIRLRKLAELIHNSAALPNCQRCSVTVHFCDIIDDVPGAGAGAGAGGGNPDGFTKVPGSDFTLMRAVDTNSTSTYYLDGRVVPLSVVEERLLSKGIDLTHNRFLILQGEVEQIAMMKPKGTPAANGGAGEVGLLEYLESIIGTTKFGPAIAVARARYDRINDRRAQSLRKLKVEEQENTTLTQCKDDAVAADELEYSAYKDTALLFCVKQAKTTEEVAEAQLEVEQKEQAIQMEDDKSKDSIAAFKAADEAVNKQEEAKDKAAAAVAKLKAEFSQLNEEDARLRADMSNAKKQGRAAMDAHAKAQKELAEGDEKHKAAEDSLPALEKTIADLQADRARCEKEREELFQKVKAETAEIKAQLEAKEKEKLPLAEAVNEATAARKAIQSELDLVREAGERSGQLVKKLSAEIAAAEADAAAATSALDACGRELRQQEDKQQQLQGSMAGLSHACADASRRREDTFAKVSALRDARRHLTQQAPRPPMYTKFAQLAAADNVLKRGYLGVLGDLATIPAEYDVAVSTAAPSLRNMLMDNALSAQRGIEILRQHNLGRATFVCLDKQEASFPERAMACPNNIPEGATRLFDLLTISEDRFRPAFFSTLRHTLVVKDLETANRVAYGSSQRWRVVTLDGGLIDVSGTMAGGGKMVMKGVVRIGGGGRAQQANNSKQQDAEAVSEAAVNEAENAAKRAEAELTAADRARQQQTAELAATARQVVRLRGEVDRHSAAADAAAQRVSQHKERLARAKAAAAAAVENASARGGNKHTEQDLAAAEAREKAAIAATASVQKDIDAIKKQMLAKGGSSLHEAQQRMIAAKSKLEAAVKQMDKTKAAVEGWPDKRARLAADVEERNAEVETLTARYKAIHADVGVLEQRASACIQGLSEGEAELAAAQLALSEAHKARDAANEQLEKYKARRQQLEQALAVATKSLSNAQDKLAMVTARQAEVERTIRLIAARIVAAKAPISAVEVWKDARLAQQKERRSLLEAARNDAAEARKQLNMEDGDGAGAGAGGRKRKAKAAVAREGALQAQAQAAEELAADLLEGGGMDDEEDEAELAAQEENARAADAAMPVIPPPEPFVAPPMDTAEARAALLDINAAALEQRIRAAEAEVEQRRRAFAGGGGGDPIEEWRKQERAFLVHKAVFEATSQERDAAARQHELLRSKRLQSFMVGFQAIALKLKEMYQMLTLGGDADLELADKNDPFSEGVNFTVRPVNKSWKAIQNLSGGEKTLSSLALVFALHHYKPAPLYVLDEIDAALDFKNVSVVANYVQTRATDAQFVIVSLRNNMFELADRLVGIYKTNNVTKTVTIDPRGFQQEQEQEQQQQQQQQQGQLQQA